MYDLNIDGFMSEPELMQISKWASNVPHNGVIVELGSYKGRSSYAWAKSCDSSVTVYCLDSFDGTSFDDFERNTKDIPNIIPIRCLAPYDMGTWVDQEIDLFFIDASHSNPFDIAAINYFLPLIKQGGIICGHDYVLGYTEWPDIITNVHTLEERLNQKVTTYIDTTLWSFTV